MIDISFEPDLVDSSIYVETLAFRSIISSVSLL